MRGRVPAARPGRDGHPRRGTAADEAAEAYAQLDELARMAKADGDPRPIAQIRTELFSLLLRRPGGSGQPGVAAHLTITATLDSLTGATTAGGVGERAGHHRRPRPGAAGPDRRPRADRPPRAAG